MKAIQVPCPAHRFSWMLVRAMLMLAAICIFAAVQANAKIHLKISACRIAIDAFNHWTSGTSWEDIEHYNNFNAIRPTVDLVLQLQALRAGGLDFDFEFVPAPDYERAKLKVLQGEAVLTAETIWDDEITKHENILFKTIPIIREGEFVLGIYTLPSNEKLLKINTLEELRQYTAVVVESWTHDVATLQGMNLKKIEQVGHFDAVFLRLQNKQADFMLTQFSTKPDMSTEHRGIKLVPVPKCTVTLHGSRCWIVAQGSPIGAQVFTALKTGSKILRNNGTIERAYRESGFINAHVADWKRLF